MDKLEVAVIGAGYWGRKHIEEYLAIGMSVTAADVNSDTLDRCKKIYKLRVEPSYKKIIENKDIIAVSICTPNETHYRIARDCLISGKNIIVEKPLAMTIKNGIELIDLAKDNKLTLVVGHVYRFNNAINQVKKMIDQHELKDIIILKFIWTNKEQVFHNRDVIFDLAPHPFDIINYLFGRNPDEISCIGNAYRRSLDQGAEAVFINCRMDNVIINIELSWLTWPKTRLMKIVTSSKSVTIDCTAQTIMIEGGNASSKREVLPNNTIRDELEDFLNNISDNSNKSISSGEVGLEIIKMLEASKKSLEENRLIMIK
jgi:predicted dehydrogenase